MTDFVKRWMDEHGVSIVMRVGYHNLARQVFAASYRYRGKILDSQCAFYKFLWISRGLDAGLAVELAGLILKKPWEHNTIIKRSKV